MKYYWYDCRETDYNIVIADLNRKEDCFTVIIQFTAGDLFDKFNPGDQITDGQYWREFYRLDEHILISKIFEEWEYVNTSKITV